MDPNLLLTGNELTKLASAKDLASVVHLKHDQREMEMTAFFKWKLGKIKNNGQGNQIKS